jgi:hypothetical protein
MRLLRLVLAVVLTSVAVLCEMALVPDAVARMGDAIRAQDAITRDVVDFPGPDVAPMLPLREGEILRHPALRGANGGAEATFRESRLLAERHPPTQEYPRPPRIYDASGHDG